MKLTTFVLLAFASCAVTEAQSDRPEISETAIRALTVQAMASSPAGDLNQPILFLDRAIQKQWGDFISVGISIVRSDDLYVLLQMPYAMYRQELIERMRKREPIESIPWSDDAVIRVAPTRINSPDVIKIIVERDGKEIAPTKNLLLPTPLQTAIGFKKVLHQGAVMFPRSAFAPGAKVTVTVIPESDRNIVLTISNSDLEQLR